jgi:hypothetical protein
MDHTIDLPAFQSLLQRLENGEVSIRLRLLGEPWTKFSRIILLSESAMIVQDSDDRKTIINIRNIIEFELDKPVEGISASTRYAISY